MTFSCQSKRTALKRCVLKFLRRTAHRTPQPSAPEVRPHHCPRGRRQCAQTGWSTSRAAEGGCGGAVTLRSGRFSKDQVQPQSNRANLTTWHPEHAMQDSEQPHKATGANFHLIPESQSSRPQITQTNCSCQPPASSHLLSSSKPRTPITA